MTMRSISLSRGMRVGLPAVLLSLWAAVFLYRLFQTQVVNAAMYQAKAQANTSRTIILTPQRGTVFFKDGQVAVSDAPRYDLQLRAGKLTLTAISLDQVRNLVLHSLQDERTELREELIAALAEREPFVAEVAAATGEVPTVIAKALLGALEAIERGWVTGNTPQPFVEGIPRERWLAIAQRTSDSILPPVSNWRAVDVAVGHRRTYPQGALAGSVLGTVKTLSSEEYEQMGRSGLAISRYGARQPWYAAKLKAMNKDQMVALGTAFGSLEIPPQPPEYVDEAVRLLREIAAPQDTGGEACPTTLSIGRHLWDLAAAAGETTPEGADALSSQLQALGLDALYKIAAEPPLLELSDGEKVWVGTYGGSRRYLPGDTLGSMGVEQYYNDLLRGKHGFVEQSRLKTIERSADGEIREGAADAAGSADATAAPGYERIPGEDLYLTLDPAWQRAAEETLQGDGEPGVIIVMQAQTGAIECLAMYPSFDPAVFSERRNAEITALIQNPDSPLLNRAIQGIYAPGSILKPVVSLGALKSGAVNLQFSMFCEGSVKNSQGKYVIGCHGSAHGQTDVVHALKKSCNCFYHYVAQRWSIEGMDAWLLETGVGQRTGIDLPSENSGFLPTPEWKQNTWHEKWLSIETSHMAIGQGSVQVTPLQAAVSMALVANGGKVVRPHVVNRPGADAIVRDLKLNPEHLRAVQTGLRDCVNEIGGTAYRTFHEGERLPVTLAGKTGTADVKFKGEPRVNSWFSAYWPAEKPEYVIIAVVPNAPPGASGGLVAGSLAKRTMQQVLGGKARDH